MPSLAGALERSPISDRREVGSSSLPRPTAQTMAGVVCMASDLSFVEFVVDQLDKDCAVTYKRMFGEFGLYSDGGAF